jgi:hypothetical protein
VACWNALFKLCPATLTAMGEVIPCTPYLVAISRYILRPGSRLTASVGLSSQDLIAACEGSRVTPGPYVLRLGSQSLCGLDSAHHSCKLTST